MVVNESALLKMMKKTGSSTLARFNGRKKAVPPPTKVRAPHNL